MALIFIGYAKAAKPEPKLTDQELRDSIFTAAMFMGTTEKNVAKTRITTDENGIHWIETGDDNLQAGKTFSYLSYLYEDLSILIITPEEGRDYASQHLQNLRNWFLKQENGPKAVNTYAVVNSGGGIAIVLSLAGWPFFIEDDRSMLTVQESADSVKKVLKNWQLTKEIRKFCH